MDCYTEVKDSGVLYEVRINDVIIWSRFVAFGRDKAHRAGGVAFRLTALEQERVAYRHDPLPYARMGSDDRPNSDG
jgi:hypothetical protein